MTSDHFKADIFDGFDGVLMGDIHRRQTVQQRNKKSRKPIVTYAGSLCQQSHGEYLENHGYLLWDMKRLTFTEHNIHNDWGYLTIDVQKGVIPQWVYDEVGTKLPKYPRLRVRFTETDPIQIKDVSAELQRMFKVSEITISKQDTLSSLKTRNRNVKNLSGNIRETDVQNQLIKDYLERQFLLDNKTLEKVVEINTEYNSKIQHEEIDNVLWIPKRFEFSNMFSYGEDNKIDFENAKGIIGLFAPNTSGKSSLFDALSFCIFDKCSRAFRANHIMNNKRDNFRCHFHFQIDNIDYFIERNAYINRSGKVKVDVEFWREIDGVKESLNGDERKDTNGLIRKYMGTYEDFVMTSLSLQGNNALFIDKSQSERKDILAQYMGLNVFDKLFEVVSDENRESMALLKSFKREDYGQKIIELDSVIQKEESDFETLKLERDSFEFDKSAMDKQLIVLESQIKDTVESIDLSDTEQRLAKSKDEVSSIDERLTKMSDQLVQIEEVVSRLKTKNSQPSPYTKTIEEAHSHYTELMKDHDRKQREIELYKSKLDAQKEKLVHLSKHEYDPNCKFCVNNVFVKDAIQTKQVVEEMETELNRLQQEASNVLNDTYQYPDIETVYKEHSTTQKELSNAVTLQSRIRAEISSAELKRKTTEEEIEKLEARISEYHKNREQIERNLSIRKEIVDTKRIYTSVKSRLKSMEDRILKSNGALSKYKTEKAGHQATIDRVKGLEEQNKLFEYYLDAVKRDGISYELISKALPAIEGEINNILGQIVDFQITLHMDGKNVNAYLVYGDDRFWPLEMCSGMEKFISGLAIRVALINICNLPRPNFLVIDEGFGAIDQENLQSLMMAFAYLKTQFEFVVVISHIDSMRDYVDTHIEVEKKDGFSKVRFV